MNIGEMVVRFTADVASFTSGAQQVTNSVQQIHTSAEVHMSGFTSAVKGGLSSLLEFGAHAYQTFLGIKGVFDVVTNSIGGMLSYNANLEQTTVAFTTILHSSSAAKDMLDQLQQFAAATPFRFPELADAARSLLAFGFNAKDIIPDLTAIGDAASANASPLHSQSDIMNTIVEVMGKIQAGGKVNAEQMQQLADVGINGWQLIADKMGLTVAQVQNLSQQGKLTSQEVLPALTSGFEKLYGGGMQQQAQTFNGLLSTLQDNAAQALGVITGPLFDLAKQGLGQLVQLVSSKGFNDFAKMLSQDIAGGLKAVGDVLGPLIGQVGDFLGSLNIGSKIQQAFAGLGEIGKQLDLSGLMTALAPLGGLVSHLAGDAGLLVTVFMNSAWKSFQATLAQWGPIVQQLAGWFQSQMLPAIMQLVPPIEDLVDTIISTGVPAFFAVRDAVSQVVAALASTLLPIFQVVAPIIVQVAGVVLHLANQALQFLIPKVVQAAHAIGDFASGLANRLQPFIKAVAGAIQQAATVIGAVWNTLWPTMSAVVKFVWDDISGVIKTAWDFITGLFDIAADLLSGKWGQLWDDIKQLGINIWNDIKNWFGGLWNDIGGIWQNLWDSIKGVPLGIWDDVKGGIADALNFVIGLINDFIQGINDVIHGMDMVPGVNIPYVPKIPNVSFASGGIMPQSGLALVGERGSEVVALPGGATVFPHDVVSQLLLFTSLMGGGASAGWSGMQASVMPATQQAGVSASEPQESSPGGTLTQELHVHVYLNGREVAHQVMTEAVAQLRNAGVRA